MSLVEANEQLKAFLRAQAVFEPFRDHFRCAWVPAHVSAIRIKLHALGLTRLYQR